MGGCQGLSPGILSDRYCLLWRYALRVGHTRTQPFAGNTANKLDSWDTGLIGGVLTMDAFQHSFNLDKNSSSFADLQGNIVSVLQGGCFFGAASSFWLSDKV